MPPVKTQVINVPVSTFLLCVSRHRSQIPPRKKEREAGSCKLQLGLIGWLRYRRLGWEYTKYLYVEEVVLSRGCSEMGVSGTWCLVVGSSGV